MIVPIWLAAAMLLSLLVGLAVLFLVGRSTPEASPIDERAAGMMAAGLLPLVDCPRDREACLRCLQVDRCVVHRLLELGLTPGTKVRVVQDSGGPMLLSVRGSRVALGRDLAERMWVELPAIDTLDIPAN
jgi:ferrous iron transport protein A